MIYIKVGCFKDDMCFLCFFFELFFIDRDLLVEKYSKIFIDWKNWNFYMKDFVCCCVKEVKFCNFVYFSI